MSYLNKRLKESKITSEQNNALGFPTFDSYFYSMLQSDQYGLSEKEREKRVIKTKNDNIKISYCDLNGGPLHIKPKGRAWSARYERLRFSDDNRRYYMPDENGGTKEVLGPKYISGKGFSNWPFLNGLFTYDCFPENGTLYITEGEFKAFVACKFGFPTIGVSGIHNAVKTVKKWVGTYPNEIERTVDANVIEPIQDFIKLNHINKVCFIYDADIWDNYDNFNRAASFFASVKNMFMGFSKIGVALDIGWIEHSEYKGLDDVLLGQGHLNETITIKKICNNLDVEKLRVPFAFSATYSGPQFLADDSPIVRQYVSGTKLSNVMQPDEMMHCNNIIPTGSGKTYNIARLKGYTIITVPTNALADNIKGEYKAFKYNSASKKRLKDFLIDSTGRALITVTYDSLPGLVKSIIKFERDTNCLLREFTLVIDEAHNFTASSSSAYRLDAMTKLRNHLPLFNRVAFLSGTHLYNFDPYINALPINRVVIPMNTVPARMVKSNDTIIAVAEQIRTSIEAGRFPIVLLNSKTDTSRLGKLKTYLKDLKGLKYFNSTTKQDVAFQSLMNKGQLPEDVKGVVTTTVLKEGNNITNKYHFDFILTGSFHPIEWGQFVRRARQPESVSIKWVVSKNKTFEANIISPYEIAARLIKVTNASKAELEIADVSSDLIFYEHISRNIIGQENPMFFNEETGKWEFNFLLLSNMVFEYDKYQINNNLKQLKSELEKYDIILEDNIGTNETEATSEEKSKVKEFKEKAKAIKTDDYLRTLDQIADMGGLGFQYVDTKLSELIRKDNQATEGEKMAYKRMDSMRNFFASAFYLAQELKEIPVSELKFKNYKKRVLFQVLLNDREFMESNRKHTIVLKALVNTFDSTTQYTGQEVKEKFLEVLNIDKGINTEKYYKFSEKKNMQNVFKTLRYFYDIARRSDKDSNKVYSFNRLEDIDNVHLERTMSADNVLQENKEEILAVF